MIMYDNRSVSQRSEAAEIADFAASVSGTLDQHWGDATSAGTGDLAGLAENALAQGWFELGEAEALEHLVAAVRELGRRGCPLPLADAFVSTLVLPDELAAAVTTGQIRPVITDSTHDTDDTDGNRWGPLEGAAGATHLLVLSGTSGWRLLEILDREATTGLAAPAWHLVTTGEQTASGVHSAWAGQLLRLAVVTRALAAAGRMHELAIAHAKARRQFGKVIGGFGAVQQRIAACHIDLTAAEALVDEAVHQLLAGRHGRQAAELAVQHAGDVMTSIASGALYTLGAIGYFEEHEAAWLLRRVQADRLLASGDPDQVPVADALLADDGALPPLELGEKAESFRAEVHEMLRRHTGEQGVEIEGLRAEMTERRLFALGWPLADGGLEASTEEQVVLHEELKYAGGPVDRAMSATMLLGHSLLRHGTEEQKNTFLPLISSGRMAFCLGYSEPEAGSDLAALRTRAEPDGDGWVINGQKLWTTRGNTASHVWLAVKTDPEASPPHAGVTIFLVPMDTPGVVVQNHVALSGEISCTVFYDDVRVPDSCRVGEVDGGWKVITDALAAERVVMGGVAATMRRQLDALLGHLRAAPRPLGAAGRTRLAQLAARLQAARVLVVRATRAMEGTEARTVGPVAAVLSGELAVELGEASIHLLGLRGALAPGEPGALMAAGGVSFDHALRLAPMFVIGGGTNDIQRGIIARALGLPRE